MANGGGDLMRTNSKVRTRLIAFCALMILLCGITAWRAFAPPHAFLPYCGLSTDRHASTYSAFINKIVVLDDDTASRRIMKFTKAASATWVTDESKCQRATQSIDTTFWSAPQGGPIYLMQVGTDYAAFPGARHVIANSIFLHLDSNFKVVASGAW
jgi:hypothetical protein